ncbi:hypothetical protein ACU4GA_13105 [Methylobacterium oryzae CBMB20]
MDTTQALTDVEMFEWLRPVVDGFRNYVDDGFGQMTRSVSPEEMFLDKANLLTLTAPEWTVLTGGLRALNANHDRSNRGVLTDRVGVLTTDFFRNLTDVDLVWEKADSDGMTFALKDRASGQTKFEATRSDLVFGSNAQLRSIADAYAGSDRPAALRGGLRQGLGQDHDARPLRREGSPTLRADGGLKPEIETARAGGAAASQGARRVTA